MIITGSYVGIFLYEILLKALYSVLSSLVTGFSTVHLLKFSTPWGAFWPGATLGAYIMPYQGRTLCHI